MADELTAADIKDTLLWLEAFDRCPACNTFKWGIAPGQHIAETLIQNPDGGSPLIAPVEHALIRCTKCGYVRFHDVETLKEQNKRRKSENG